MYVFAEVWGLQYVEGLLAPVLALAVWVIYTLDRLVDVKIHGEMLQEPRHQFHRRHQKLLLALVVLAVLVIVSSSLRFLQWSIIESAMLPVIGLSAFLILSVFSPSASRVSYTKNIIAGITFAMGCITGLLGLSARSMVTSMMSPEMVCFAAICVLNITAIDFWARPRPRQTTDDEDVVAEWSLTLPLLVVALFALLYKYKEGNEASRPFFDVIVVCCGLMYVMNRMRQKLGPDKLRVGADVILLIGAALYWLIRA